MNETYAIKDIRLKAEQVFGARSSAKAWLNSPCIVLNDQTPISLLETKDGRILVHDVLLRIEYGIYS
jgi:putative toxin-antitoxin system antitoxin component (TIGR02293 family)